MKVLIDNGHGFNTPGKCSPDGKHHEWAWTREIAQMLLEELTKRGIDAQCIVNEANDITLVERARRVNTICDRYGAAHVMLVSIHSNAAGNGQWMQARGWSAYTSRGQTKADALATHIYEAARKHLPGHKLRTDYTDSDPDLESGFYILAKTKCPAVLTENLFHDNRDDVAFITSPQGKRAIVLTHADGICNYLKSIGK